jgi:hypothetical protein
MTLKVGEREEQKKKKKKKKKNELRCVIDSGRVEKV